MFITAYDQVKILLPVLGKTLWAKVVLVLLFVRCTSEIDQIIGRKIIAAKLTRKIVQHCSKIMTNIPQITQCNVKVANDNFRQNSIFSHQLGWLAEN